MQASTIIPTNEFNTSTTQTLSVVIVKMEPTYDSMIMLLDLYDDICVAIDLFNTSQFPLEMHMGLHHTLCEFA